MVETVKFKAEQLLFKEGDEGGGLYIIRRGRVRVFRERNNLEVSLAELGPGDVLGSMTLLTGEPRTASVRALDEVEAVIMDAASFASGLGELPKWASVVIKDLTTRVKNVNEMLVESSLRDRRLRHQMSNVFHHLGQFAHYLAFVMRNTSKVDDVLGEVTPFRDVISQAEPVLNLRYEYLVQLWNVIAATGIVREDKSWGYGLVLVNPQPRLFTALGDHAFHIARKGISASTVKPKTEDEDAARRRILFERICRALLDAEIEATAADRAYL